MELAADPSPHVFVFLMLWIEPGIKEVGIAGRSAHILWRSGAVAGNATGIFYTFFARKTLQTKQMTPTVPEVVFVKDSEGVLFAAVWEVKVDHPDLGSFEDLTVEQPVFIKLRCAVDQPTDIELVQMAVGPAEGSLQNFMELSEVECDRQFENTADLGFNVEDMDLGADDKAIRVKRIKHIEIMPRRMITGNG